MKLKELLKEISLISISGPLNKDIKQIAFHSKEVSSNSLFIALKGHKHDGFDYIDEAIEKGAVAIISEKPVFQKKNGITYLQVKDAREAAGKLASAFYNYPAKYLNLIGITGTNGKTTTAYLIATILKEMGKKVGIIGTIFYKYAEKTIPSSLTTPDPLNLHRLFKEMLSSGVTDVVVEVSSHGLYYQRVSGCQFQVAVFTNLSHEHLDFHQNMEDYFQSKKLLFTHYLSKNGYAIVNLDDPWGRRLLNEINTPSLTYGLSPKAKVWAEKPKFFLDGLEANFHTPNGSFHLYSPLVGEPNILNLLAAIAVGITLKIPIDVIKNALTKAKAVPGRLERFFSNDINVFIDYAHTPDALEKALKTLRPLCKGRLITVFGCGGNRDREKRPLMGKVASHLSDIVVITDDNPRNEPPSQIIKDIEAGLDKRNYHIIPNRREAIAWAIKNAKSGDIILIAGKGHEDYQIIGNKKYHLSDREEVIKNLKEYASSR